NARMGVPSGPHGAVYLTVHPYGTVDHLTTVRTDSARLVEFHETIISADGISTMRQVPTFELPARRALTLTPGGFHLMLIDVDRLEVGDVARMTLVWEQAGEIEVDVTVVHPSDTLVDHNHDHNHDVDE